jgi:hypothetical protein
VSGRLDSVLRVLASIAGTLPVAVLAALCFARFLPGSESLRLTLSFTLAPLVWIGATCLVFLARSATRAWLPCLALSALFAALAYGVPP